ncbi:unnamed protein product, partial [Mesorhabditis belari]|uniref:Uncharacterized protein n=1 Tax=Mesorhabditis belari TaxID=2138241 RepID=A0AAF3EAA1_9BILA
MTPSSNSSQSGEPSGTASTLPPSTNGFLGDPLKNDSPGILKNRNTSNESPLQNGIPKNTDSPRSNNSTPGSGQRVRISDSISQIPPRRRFDDDNLIFDFSLVPFGTKEPILEEVETSEVSQSVASSLVIPKSKSIEPIITPNSKNIHNLYIRTDDLWLDLDEEDLDCFADNASPISPTSIIKPAIALAPPPKSAPPCPSSAVQVIQVGGKQIANGQMTPVSMSNGGTPTILRDDLLRPTDLEAMRRQVVANGEARLQQSLSTPCQNDGLQSPRKDAEYRRFKSEGSAGGPLHPSGGPEMDVPLTDDLSPIADPRSSPPHRLNLFQQDSVVNGPLTKHSHTEQVMMMHTLKTKLSKYQSFIDKAFQLIAQNTEDQIIEGCNIVAKVMIKAWTFPKVSHDLSYALCDYLRDQKYFEILLQFFINPTTSETVRLTCGRVLEECMSTNNRDYIVTKNLLKKLVSTAEKLNKNPDQQRISLSIMESLFKHSTQTSYRLIEYGVLDHIILTCKRSTDTPRTLRHAALALANLALYSCSEGKKKIMQKKVPEWLFLLASQPDDLTRYYACLAICVFGSSKEMETAVNKSGTLGLVEPFLLSHSATQFAGDHYKYSQGRPKEWLVRLLPLLQFKINQCREARSMAAFHLTMEATIKKDQNKLDVFQTL